MRPEDWFGLFWQINYAGIPVMLSGDRARAARVMDAIMKMHKVDIRALQAAAAG